MNPIPRGSTLRSLLLYALLVGIPLAALLAILRAGRGLDAPSAVGGWWEVTVDAASAPHPACVPWVRELAEHGIAVTQSGEHLSITLRQDRERRLNGRLKRDSIKADFRPRLRLTPPITRCDPAVGLRLSAAVDADARPAVMRGWLRYSSCPECAPLAFTAVRRPVGRGRGR